MTGHGGSVGQEGTDAVCMLVLGGVSMCFGYHFLLQWVTKAF